MTPKANGAVGPARNRHDAADKHVERTTRIDEREVRRVVRDELRRMLARLVDDDRVYSTRRGCAPEGYSRDAWRDLARRIGVPRGRYWVVTQAQLAAYEAGQAAPPPPANDAPASTWTPADAMRDLGLRPAGGTR